MNNLWEDIRYAARTLRKNPGLTWIVVFTLALCIGASIVIFSFINALLLTPLPFKDPEQLVRVMSERGMESGKLSLLEVYDLNDQTKLFDGFASFRNSQYNVTGNGQPQAIIASINTYNLFDLLGIKPHIGDTWPQAHERARVFNIVLSYDVWQRLFGGDVSTVGKKILLDGAEYEVLGVMPKGFDFPLNAGCYRRVPPADFDSRSIRESDVVARLKPNVTVEQAEAELDGLAEQWQQTYPETNTGLRIKVIPFREHYIGEAESYLWLIFGAVLFVLLIACVNVINLLLARALARGKELAVRAALGASRRRLVQHLLTESLLLTLIGGALGLALSPVLVHSLTSLIRLDLPLWMDITIDVNVLLFALVISIFVGLLAGIIPALHTSRPNLNVALKDGMRGSSAGASGYRARRILIISQVALALVLLAGAGLMIQSVLLLQKTSLGFRPERLLTMKMDPPWTKYSLIEQTGPFYKRVLEEVKVIP
jgi:putative ABC transport system permease protein